LTIGPNQPSRAASPRLPDFVCIGGMRCGSTTLWHLLNRHPEIFLPEEKELHYFDDARGRYERGGEWYAKQFAAAEESQVCGEVTPSYLHQEPVPSRMVELLRRPRLLVILRDSAKRAWSHYWFRVRQGREPLSFSKALERERQGAHSLKDRGSLWRFSYIGWSRFIDGIRRFEQAFGREAIRVVFFEELLRDPNGVMQIVWEHLDVEPIRVDALPHSNEMLTPRMRRLHCVLTARKRGHEGYRTGYQRLEQRVIRRINRWNLQSGSRPIPPHVLSELRKQLATADQELAEWLGRGLPWDEQTRKWEIQSLY